jgi:hypothetical protein
MSVIMAAEHDVVFCIGEPDAFCSEFSLTKEGYAAFKNKFSNGVTYTVGKSTPKNDWAFVHPSTKDNWAGNKNYPFTIKFDLPNLSNVLSEFFNKLVVCCLAMTTCRN